MFLRPEVVLPKEPLDLGDVNVQGVVDFLVKENDFSEDRVVAALERLQRAMREVKESKRQTGLDQWF